VPELANSPWKGEPRATCDRCTLAPAHSGATPGQPWAFDPDVRCCTFNPAIPNFLAGRALRRGGVSEERIRARLANPDGVGSWGIRPWKGWVDEYESKHEGFGKDKSLTCPYWVAGPQGCGIWHDRNNVCRTWFCRHDQGDRAKKWWRHAKEVLAAAEILLAELVAEGATAPGKDGSVEDWVAFYVGCAERADHVSPEDMQRLQHPELVKRRKLLANGPPGPRPVPDVVTPSPSTAQKDGDRAWLAGYTAYDTVMAPLSVFVFLSLLDGKRTWRQALDETNATAGVPLAESTVMELHRIGAIRSPQPGDIPGTEGDDPDMREVQAGVFFAWRSDPT
jgi:hypothetical protein